MPSSAACQLSSLFWWCGGGGMVVIQFDLNGIGIESTQKNPKKHSYNTPFLRQCKPQEDCTTQVQQQ
jgi:cellobiose-specific phosphotransferase system component IIC